MHWALTAYTANASMPTVSDAAMAVSEILGISVADFSVRAFAPENFFFRFHSEAACNRTLAAGSITLGNTQLFFKQWTRVASATLDSFFLEVQLELDGISAHAWNINSAYQLLSPYGWIEKLNPEIADKSDISSFYLTIWIDDISRFPAEKKLRVVEPEQVVVHNSPNMERIFGHLPVYLMRKKVLTYNVQLHV